MYWSFSALLESCLYYAFLQFHFSTSNGSLHHLLNSKAINHSRANFDQLQINQLDSLVLALHTLPRTSGWKLQQFTSTFVSFVALSWLHRVLQSTYSRTHIHQETSVHMTAAQSFAKAVNSTTPRNMCSAFHSFTGK